MVKYIKSGIREQDGQYIADYTYNLPEDIINIQPPQLYKSEYGNNVYWFGYKFNDGVPTQQKTKFLRSIKGLSDSSIPDSDLQRLIELPLAELDDRINLYDIDCFVYPLSNRSQLVNRMISAINKRTSRDMSRVSFELIKSIPTEVEFDWELFESEHGYDKKSYRQMAKYIKDELMPKIAKLDYFSLAQSVKPKYRKYIKNYLSFSAESAEKISKLQGANILIVDDINTSGSTLDEILRILGKLNHSCNIYIYTLIGN